MMVLVTGYAGQLGFDVVCQLESRGIACRGVDLADFDLTDEQATRAYVLACQPTAIIHCAAYTAVDQAEDQPERCHAVNVAGTANLARAAQVLGARFLYISTDYVFRGDGTHERETDEPRAPQNHYGLTKSLGEDIVRALLPERHQIVRTSWVFGVHGPGNFVKTMLRLGRERDEISVVADQVGSPTYTADLAVLLCDLIESDCTGTFHATNEGTCSWAEFAAAIMQMAGLPARIKPIPSEAYPTRAARPKNSRLAKTSLDRAGFKRLPHWRNALGRYLADLAAKRRSP
jgi:dTDP-4-dehydrorhamnose reductase